MKNLNIQTAVVLFLLTFIASCNNRQAKKGEGEIVGEWMNDVAVDFGYRLEIVNGEYMMSGFSVSKNKSWPLFKLKKEIRNGQVVFLDGSDGYFALESNGDLSACEDGVVMGRFKKYE